VAEHDTLLLCDADLKGLQSQHFFDLVEAYREGFAMVIMDKGAQPWIFREFFKSTAAVSGTRILERNHFLAVPFRETDRFQFENRINDYFLERDLPIAVTPAEGVYDPRKYVKYPFLQGLLLDLRGGWQVLASDGPASIPHNLIVFRRISSIRRGAGER
jgi:hypothetical protein